MRAACGAVSALNATALIVELVLAGILMLVALLIPAVAIENGIGAGVADGLDGSAIVAVAIAAGFVLGVIVDRAADTLLDQWLGACRLQFAYTPRVRDQRRTWIESAQSRSSAPLAVADCFPEDWMRDLVTQSTSESVVENLGQLRIRIRVARNMAVLTPALTTSAVIALSVYANRIPNAFETWLVPLIHLVGLLILVLLSGAHAFRSPRTDDSPNTSAEPADKYAHWLLVSPATFWLILQLAVAGSGLVRTPSAARPLAAAALAVGATLTALAIWAWWRMTRTYFATIWNYSRFNEPDGLVGALVGKAAGVIQISRWGESVPK